MYIKSGSDFDADIKDGIWIDDEFASRRNLNVGDSIKINFMDMDYTYKIKGLVYSPEYVYKESKQMIPDHYMNGFAYISRNSLPEYFPTVYNQMLIILDSSDVDINEIEPKLFNTLPKDEANGSGGLSVFLDRSKITSHVVFNNEISERKAMTTVFPIAFLIIVLLTIMTTMSRLINNQRTQIGTLKALGVKKHKIVLHYMSYSFFLTSVGGILGLIGGPMILPSMFYEPMKTTYTLPVWKPHFIVSSLVVLISCVFLASLITYISCKKILAETPASALRPKVTKSMKLTALEKSSFWKKRSFMVQWNLRDICFSKIRSIMAVVGVAGCMGLLLMGFGAMDAFNSVIDIKYDRINVYENKYILDENASATDIDSIVAKVDGQKVMEQMITIKSNKTKEVCELQIHDDVTLYKYLDENWNEFDMSDDGIMISKKLAEKLNLNVGENIEWCTFGEENWNKTKITAIYRDPAEQGCIMPNSEYEKAGKEFVPTSILSSKEKVDGLSGVSTVENIKGSRDSISTMLETMTLLISVVCVVAGILEVVVLYNLGILSFAEKERELATLKVIGFQSSKIRILLLLQNVWLTLIGLIPGYFFGKLVLRIVMSYMGSEFDLPVHIEPTSVLICVVFTCVLSFMVNYLFSHKIKNIDMVSSLKGVE